MENKIGFREPSLKPILFDDIHHERRYVMLDGVTLDQLRTFIAAAEQGSFSAAGRKLRRVQSMVSQTLANLEGQLGVALFDRSARYPTLTEDGRALLENARAVGSARTLSAASNSPSRWGLSSKIHLSRWTSGLRLSGCLLIARMELARMKWGAISA
jgi:hypothetical protein